MCWDLTLLNKMGLRNRRHWVFKYLCPGSLYLDTVCTLYNTLIIQLFFIIMNSFCVFKMPQVNWHYDIFLGQHYITVWGQTITLLLLQGSAGGVPAGYKPAKPVGEYNETLDLWFVSIYRIHFYIHTSGLWITSASNNMLCLKLSASLF